MKNTKNPTIVKIFAHVAIIKIHNNMNSVRLNLINTRNIRIFLYFLHCFQLDLSIIVIVWTIYSQENFSVVRYINLCKA